MHPRPATPTASRSTASPRDAKRLIERTLNLDQKSLTDDTERAQENDIQSLINATQGHARTLSLLAPQLRAHGMAATTRDLSQLMQKMETEFPGEREQSLFASIDLSLQRLSPESRELCKPLGLFKGVVNLAILHIMTEQEMELIDRLAYELIAVGIATDAGAKVLQLHPALCPLLDRRLTDAERAHWLPRWIDALRAYVYFLEQTRRTDARLASILTLCARPNLAALLNRFPGQADPATTIDLCTDLYQILQTLGQPRLMNQVAAVRDAAQAQLTEKGANWSHVQFEAERVRIEQRLASGDLRVAHAAAQTLLATAQSAGYHAYEGADFDLAGANWLLGRILKNGGAQVQALTYSKQAQQGFAALPGTSAFRMASICHLDMGDCLLFLGRLDEAAAAYQEGIDGAKALDDRRTIAVGKMQLGSVYMLQKNPAEALAAYEEARKTFEALNEPASVATVWHQIGMVHVDTGNIDAAEAAYRNALAIAIQEQDLPKQSATYNKLGNLFDSHGRLEDAVINLRRAADIAVQQNDLANEGKHRNNLADTLIKLGEFDEARHELSRAIECDSHFGHAAEPWKTWNILHDLERADPKGDPARAAEARQSARRLFLAYRRDGGENHHFLGQLCQGLAEAIPAGETDALRETLTQLKSQADQLDDPTAFLTLLRTLTSILDGARDPALADDPDLYFQDAVEIQLLLEALANE